MVASDPICEDMSPWHSDCYCLKPVEHEEPHECWNDEGTHGTWTDDQSDTIFAYKKRHLRREIEGYKWEIKRLKMAKRRAKHHPGLGRKKRRQETAKYASQIEYVKSQLRTAYMCYPGQLPFAYHDPNIIAEYDKLWDTI